VSRQLVTNPDLKNPIPLGGTSGQVLAKNSATDYDVAWVAQSGGGLTIPLGQNLTWAPDATYDIGASGANRPRDLFMSRNLVVGGTVTTGTVGPSASGTLNLRSSGSIRWQIDSSTGAFLSASDGTLDIGASAAGRPRNLFLTSYTQQNEIAKPANPAAGQLRVYPKSDHHLYILDSTGLETDLTAGMSQAQADARYLQLTGGTISGSILTSTTNSVDLGQNAVRFRSIYAGTDLNAGNVLNLGVGPATLRSYQGGAALQTDNDLIVGGTGYTQPFFWLGADKNNAMYIDGAGNYRWTSAQQLVLQMGNAERWAFRTSGNMEALYDNTIDIGNSGGGRPRNIYAGTLIGSPAFQAPGGSPTAGGYQFVDNNNGLFYNGTRMEQRFWTGQWDWVRRENSTSARLSVQGNGAFGIGTDANPPLIRTTPANTTWLSIEASAGRVVASGKEAGDFASNAYYNAGWQRFDVSKASSLIELSETGMVLYQAPAGANPIGNFAARVNVPVSGPAILPAGTAQAPLGQYFGTPTWSSTTASTWLITVVGASVTTTGALVRVECAVTITHSTAGGQVYVGLAMDAGITAPSLGFAHVALAGGLVTVTFVFYHTPAAGAHNYSAMVYNASGGTVSLASAVNSWLYVTEQRC
jgi:hypothetical protein